MFLLFIVHGKPRHPQSQGSIERLHCDVKDMLIDWLGDNQSTDWSVGLKFVQFSKNTSHHTGIQQSPYMALFGGNHRVGLRSTALPKEILESMVSEDDPLAAFSQPQTAETTEADNVPTTAGLYCLLWAPAQRKRATMLYFANVLFIYLFFYGRLILRPWLTEVRESFTHGGP